MVVEQWREAGKGDTRGRGSRGLTITSESATTPTRTTKNKSHFQAFLETISTQPNPNQITNKQGANNTNSKVEKGTEPTKYDTGKRKRKRKGKPRKEIKSQLKNDASSAQEENPHPFTNANRLHENTTPCTKKITRFHKPNYTIPLPLHLFVATK